MGGERFDATARLLATSQTRRRFLAVAAGAALVAVVDRRVARAACDPAKLDICLRRARENAADTGIFACGGAGLTMGFFRDAIGMAGGGARAMARAGPYGLLLVIGVGLVAAAWCTLGFTWRLWRETGRCHEDYGCAEPAPAPAAPPPNCKAQGCAGEDGPEDVAEDAEPTPEPDEPQRDDCDPTCGPDYACCPGTMAGVSICLYTRANGNCGGCGIVCPPGSGCCNGSCTPLTAEPNCGGCGVSCAGGRQCCLYGSVGACLVPEIYPQICGG
jgi:hypothetical protein